MGLSEVFERLASRWAIVRSRKTREPREGAVSRRELEQFLRDREGRFQGLLVSDGVIFRTTPFDTIFWVFEQWRSNLGDLGDKRLLDFGAGDLRYSLLASNLLSMETVAAEFDSVVYLDAKESLREAERCGYASRLRLETRVNALHLPWQGFDIIHYFYTHPDTAGGETQKRSEFRRDLQEKMSEVGPDAVLSVLFTEAQVEAGHHAFPNLVPMLERRPTFACAGDVPYHLQLYRHRTSKEDEE